MTQTTRRVEIRGARADDFDRWEELWRQYQSFYKTAIPHATSIETWRRLLDSSEPMDVALAAIDGRVVGFVHFIEHRSCWTTGNYLYLQDLFVAPPFRGAGAGRLLIEHVYAVGLRRGCARVNWLTHETNLSAIKLYDQIAERTGFVQYRHVLQS
jgi:GNAT superfamily N-acetyltransferase